MSESMAIETRELSKRYGRVTAVDHLNLHVPKHQITAFLGRNGAGKSTTIKMLLGVTSPTSGTALILDKRIDDPRQNREMRLQVAYVAEDKQLYSYLTVGQLIRFTRSFYRDWQPEAETRLLKAFRLPASQKIRELSKGMRTKLALLLALARRPQLLILDEPSEGLDPVTIEELLQEIVKASALGVSVFFSSHQIAEVERVADRVCIIDRGRVLTSFSLEDMRQDYRRITLGFVADMSTICLNFPGVQNVRTNGHQITFVTRENADAVIELARDLQPISLDVSPVGLRELFLETLQEQQ